MIAVLLRLARSNLRDPKTLAVLAALGLALIAAVLPPLRATRATVRILVVVDITGSMNTRDYQIDGRPASRLTVAKAALLDLISHLPCPSHMGLALFSERVPFLLFEPMDVCRDYAAAAGAIDGLDWREAWDGDSRIAAGLYQSIDMAKSLDADLIFLTDGQEAPPLPWNGPPPFEGEKGAVRGLIVGAGGYTLSPIPKYDDRGNEIGFWSVEDVPHENHSGLPPPDAESRPGYQARNAPFGSEMPKGTEHMSSVREPYLQSLAAATGLSYAHMEGPRGLTRPLLAAASARPAEGLADLRWIPGGAALAVLLAAYTSTRKVKKMRILAACLLAAFSTAAWAHGPTPQKVDETIDIKAAPKAVWAVAGDFAGISKWDSEVKASQGDHKKRTLTMKNGEKIEEEVDEYDADRMTYTYRMLNPNPKALPASSYSATLAVTPGQNGSAHIEWKAHVYRADTENEPPEGMDDQAARESLTRFFKVGLEGIKAKAEGRS